MSDLLREFKEKTMINFDEINECFKKYDFRYAACIPIDKIVGKTGGTSEPTHRIKGRLKKGRWVFLGDEEYKTEKDARDDVEKLKEWAAT